MKPKVSASVRATLNLRISAVGKSDSLLEKEILPETPRHKLHAPP